MMIEYIHNVSEETFEKAPEKIREYINERRLVRCKDCKYRIDNQGEPWICGYPDNNAWNITPEHYCGYGEMKNDD